MYIPPNTVIYLLENIPLNSEYENTVYYPDEAHQVSAFRKYTKFTLTDYSYIRGVDNVIKVELPIQSVYKCNYLMYKNTSFEDKWMFCFIENVYYVSNEVTAICFKEDVMQTWCYDYSFLDSFVDRRHETKDILYGNLQPEGLEIGSYYTVVNEEEVVLNSSIEFAMIISDINGVTIPSQCKLTGHGLINGVYNGLYFITCPESQVGAMSTLIDNINKAGKENAVVAFYCAPSGTTSTLKHFKIFNSSPTFNGYKFKNKKLLSSPYHVVQITNNLGASIILNPEQFGHNVDHTNTNQIDYYIQNVDFPSAGTRILVENYDGLGNPVSFSIPYLQYPTNSFSGNSFQMWWAQNKNSYVQSLNAIDASYDANQQIAQNNYSMSNRSARATNQMSINSAAQQASAAEGAYETANQNLNLSTKFARDANTAKNSTGVVGDLINGEYVSAVNQGLTAAYAQQQLTLQNNIEGNNLSSQLAIANNSAATSQANAQIALDNSLQNNAVNKANSNLSNLTSKNNAINSLMAKKRDIQNTPNTAKLNASADGLNWANSTASIDIMEYFITADYLKRIDDYFNCYGYAQNKLMTGEELNNRINRKHFSYLRTVGCNIRGNLNDQDSVAIRAIYDNGVTTWDTLEDVGDYSIDNSEK